MSKSEKVMRAATVSGIAAAKKLADDLSLSLFAVDVGPGSRVDVWNKAWTRKLATGAHVSKYAA